MPVELKVTRTKSAGTQVKIGISVAFDSDNPKAAKVYKGLALMVHEMMTPAEEREFLGKLNQARRNPTGGEISGRV